MKLLLALCILAAAAHSTPSTTDFTCFWDEKDNSVCHIQGLLVDSHSPEIYPNFPAESKIYLQNAFLDFLSPDIAAKISNSTSELSILDGTAPKLYLKRTLKHFASLRSGTTEVIIDPDDNHSLEILDVAGGLRAIPANVQHLKKLAVLDLCVNAIERVDLNDLDGLVHLRKINLGRNRIQAVSLNGDVNLPALVELFLHGNRLAVLDLTRLQADNLQRFYVSQNQLTKVEGFPERFPKLARTDLHLNKWNCEWLKNVEEALAVGGAETLSYLPENVCDESGTVKVDKLECGEE